MLGRTHFVIFKSNSRYSVAECGKSGVKHAFMTDGTVSGDKSVLQRLEKMKPEALSIENYLEKHAGHLLFEQ